MTANTNPDPHSEACDETINVSGATLAKLDDALHRDGARYRLALVTLIEQALTTEQMEAMVYQNQWHIERTGIDLVIAAKAVSRHCRRVVEERSQHRRENGEMLGPVELMEIERTIRITGDIGKRWAQRLVGYEGGRL